MVTKEYKQVACLDFDPGCGCGFQVRTETEEELFRLGAEHGKLVHNMDMATIPPDMVAKFKAAVKTVKVEV